jgi:mannitol/fructose-specific phosphotransferase system IIA component (Ntr-type)
MNLSPYLDERLVLPNLTATTKPEVLEELVHSLCSVYPSLDKTSVLEVLHARERLGSTAMGDGIAMPHGKYAGIAAIHLVVGRSGNGIPFDAPDNKPCRLFFLVLAPEHATITQLGLLGRHAKVVKNESFRLCIMQARNHKDNPFDITKVWSHKDYPLIEVGVLELNRNAENYFADVEQAAFNPNNIVPGIGLSPDKLLQGRLFSYGDAQRYRLGVNHTSIPVNAPKCPVHSYHRDGLMRVDGNYGATKGYHPNSFGEWAPQPEFAEPPLAMEGTIDHHDPYVDDDCFYQPGDLYRLMTEDKRALLISNTAGDIAPVTDNVKYRHAAHCYLADAEYGTRIAEALGLDLDKVVALSGMERAKRLEATSEANWQ